MAISNISVNSENTKAAFVKLTEMAIRENFERYTTAENVSARRYYSVWSFVEDMAELTDVDVVAISGYNDDPELETSFSYIKKNGEKSTFTVECGLDYIFS